MKKYFATILLICLVMNVSAQHRGRIINETNYAELGATAQRRVGSTVNAPIPCKGSPKVPVVLVQFSDTKFSAGNGDAAATQKYFQGFFDGSGVLGVRYTDSPNYGSVADYFSAQSDSIFTPRFSVIGPVTLPQSYSYYGQNSGSSKDIHMTDFYRDACKLAATQYSVNWNDFDNNSDGRIDFVFFIFAGEAENNSSLNDPSLIWPKESASSFSVTYDDVTLKFGGYGCSNELYSGEVDGIGTSCHELSHALGLPDMYDTKYVAVGMDYWDVMDSGCYIGGAYFPCGYSAYEMDFMGWRKLEAIPYDEKTTVTLEALQNKGAKAYKIVNPANENEYFVLENRQNVGWDLHFGHLSSKYGAAHGLFITHVDYLSSAWSSNNVNGLVDHQRIGVVPSGGVAVNRNGQYTNTQYFEAMASTLYPGSKEVTEMSSYSVFTGGTIAMKLDSIVEQDGIVTFNLNGGSTTAVKPIVEMTANGDNAIYDMMGRRVVSPTKGLYIINGKKVRF